jgi:hypothetical protein
MKFTIIFLFFCQLAGAACPDLAGVYYCRDCRSPRGLRITQSNNSEGSTVYIIDDGYPHVADGIERTYTNDGGSYSVRTTCADGMATSHIRGFFYLDDDTDIHYQGIERLHKESRSLIRESLDAKGVVKYRFTYLPN